MKWLRRLFVLLLVLGLAAVLVAALLPRPVAVDLAVVERGPLQVTVDEDGQTRIKDRYVVSAPLGGQMERITLRAGDPVQAGQTRLTAIVPTPPGLLDARTLAQAEARVRVAEVSLERARPALEVAREAMQLSESNYQRAQRLLRANTITQQEYDEVAARYRTASEEFRAARLAEEIARYELETARAALLHTHPDEASANPAGRNNQLELHSPITGRVLRVFQESSTVVAPGTALVELGDPNNLEAVIDVLSSDAVRIQPADRVLMEQWGGEPTLEGAVRLVEPQGFTKVSALGVEEQRVNVIVDFLGPVETWSVLGDGYRIEARIVLWESDDVLKVPTTALSRVGQQWTVFVVEAGRARLRHVEIGRQDGLEAQVLSGLSEGEQVVLYPGDRVSDGRRVAAR